MSLSCHSKLDIFFPRHQLHLLQYFGDTTITNLNLSNHQSLSSPPHNHQNITIYSITTISTIFFGDNIFSSNNTTTNLCLSNYQFLSSPPPPPSSSSSPPSPKRHHLRSHHHLHHFFQRHHHKQFIPS